MAKPPSLLEQMIANNGPIQASIMRHLTTWEFRNLQLAGVRLPVSRAFQRRQLIPNRCNERDPDIPENQCANTTETFDNIRACAGRPMIDLPQIEMDKTIEAQKMQPCLKNEWWRVRDSNQVNEPNTSNHPIHTKVCSRCRDRYAWEQLVEQVQRIATLRVPLCKRHSLEQANPLPPNNCHCYGYINDKWRCRRCNSETLYYLEYRAEVYRKSLADSRIPWSQPWASLRSLWALIQRSKRRVCPIEGCMRQPWLDRTKRERMQLCMGCNEISRM